jgi:hypothetical protein
VRALGILAVVGLAAAALAGPADAKQAAKCRTGDPVLAQNRFLRVWEHREGEDGRLIGCRRDDGHRMTMLKTHHGIFQGASTRFDRLTLNRHFAAFVVAYESATCEVCQRIKLRSFDTRAGHRRLEAGNGPVDIEALVVTAKGAVAWAERDGADEAIQAYDHGTRTLDTGAIDPRSLGVELTVVSWTRDGEERFARLR